MARAKGGNVPKYREGRIRLPRTSGIKGPSPGRWAAAGRAFEQMGKDLEGFEKALYAKFMQDKAERDGLTDDLTSIEQVEGFSKEVYEVDRQLAEDGLVGEAYLDAREELLNPIRERYNQSFEGLDNTPFKFETDKGKNDYLVKLQMLDSNSNLKAIEVANQLDVNDKIVRAVSISNNGVLQAMRAPDYDAAKEFFHMSRQPLEELAKQKYINPKTLKEDDNKKLHRLQNNWAERDMLDDPIKELDRVSMLKKYELLTNEDLDKIEKARKAALKAGKAKTDSLNYRIRNEVSQYIDTGEYTNKEEIIKDAAEHGEDALRKTQASFEMAEGHREALNSYTDDGYSAALRPFSQQKAYAESISPAVGDLDYAMKADMRDSVKRVVDNRQKAFVKDPNGYVTKFSIGPDGKALYPNPLSPEAIQANMVHQERMGNVVPQATSLGWRTAWKERHEQMEPEEKQQQVQALEMFDNHPEFKYKQKVMSELELRAPSMLASNLDISEDKGRILLDLENTKMADVKAGLESGDIRTLEDKWMGNFDGSEIGKVMHAQLRRAAPDQGAVVKRYKEMLETGEKLTYKNYQKGLGTGAAADEAIAFIESLYGGIYKENSVAIFINPNMPKRNRNELEDALEWYREEVMPDQVKWLESELNVEGMPDIAGSEIEKIQDAMWQNDVGTDVYTLINEFGERWKDADRENVFVTQLEIIEAYRAAEAVRKAEAKKRTKEAEEFMIP